MDVGQTVQSYSLLFWVKFMKYKDSCLFFFMVAGAVINPRSHWGEGYGVKAMELVCMEMDEI